MPTTTPTDRAAAALRAARDDRHANDARTVFSSIDADDLAVGICQRVHPARWERPATSTPDGPCARSALAAVEHLLE